LSRVARPERKASEVGENGFEEGAERESATRPLRSPFRRKMKKMLGAKESKKRKVPERAKRTASPSK
jgi:hypothetical protein